MSDIISSLVINRTREDVDFLLEIRDRIMLEGFDALQENYKRDWLAGMKGAYNYTDMNRVGEATLFIANQLIRLPKEVEQYCKENGVDYSDEYKVPYDPGSIVVNPKTDWNRGDIPTRTEIKTYLEEIQLLRSKLELRNKLPETPTSLDRMTYETANLIERILLNISISYDEFLEEAIDRVDQTVPAYQYCNMEYCG